MQNQNLFVITGGPGAGKTSIVEELRQRGFATVAEIARQIIQEQVAAKGTALPWSDTKSYTDKMLARSIESYVEHSEAEAVTFLDRGIPDTLCYAQLIQVPATAAIELACRSYRYNPRVFMLPPWQGIYRTDSERKQNFEEAQRTYETMVHTYQACEYEVCTVPAGEVRFRADFILRLL